MGLVELCLNVDIVDTVKKNHLPPIFMGKNQKNFICLNAQKLTVKKNFGIERLKGNLISKSDSRGGRNVYVIKLSRKDGEKKILYTWVKQISILYKDISGT